MSEEQENKSTEQDYKSTEPEYKFVPPNAKQKRFTVAEHSALQEKEAKKNIPIPAPVKFLLGTPVVIALCFGIFYIPVLIFQFITALLHPPQNTAKTEQTTSSKSASTSP